MRARLQLHAAPGAAPSREPITIGLAVPRGLCRDARHVSLVDSERGDVPLQARALERWSDGSVRWLLLDFQAIPGNEGTGLEVDFAERGAAVAHPSPVVVTSEGSAVGVATGDFSLRVAPGRAGAPLIVRRGERELLDPERTRLTVRAAGGADVGLTIDAVAIEESGPLRAALIATGQFEGTGLAATLRIEVFAGLPVVRVRMRLHNPRAAQHPGGFWELGDPGSVLVEQVSLRLAPASPMRGARGSFERETAMTDVAVPFRLHQESSGRDNWQSPVHTTRTGVASPRYRGYRWSAGATSGEGLTASPIVHVETNDAGLAVTSRLFWEVFPKAYAIDERGAVSIDLLPADRVEDHELQGGERYGHEMTIAFDRDPHVVDWARSPSLPIVDPDWWAGSGAVSHLSVVSDPQHGYERLVGAALDGDDTFVAKRDRIDEYGWRNFGDLYADHENGSSTGSQESGKGLTPSPSPLRVSHYNNQYDGIAGLLAQFMRSGDTRWWTLGRDLAAHVRDIDVYATADDRGAYAGGLFWHTCHYVDAGRATHRSYPNAPGVPGGGPSNEHNYSTGLLLHHLMTGDPDSREAVLRLAHWTVAMDDGRSTVFRLLAKSPTGLASATGAVDYHGPGRGPANGIHTLLNAVRLTGDRTWLDHAEALIRRCIHPHDDLAARNLLDAERRWYYTVFLQMLGRYLAFKSERGEEDAMWRYARASLLHYARWMAVHEYPYLEKPAILEFPTETWAAQDMRKCEVFDLAADYAETADERARFVERAGYFFEQSIATLHQWPTRTWTRPVVLMLSYGYAHLWHEAHRAERPLLAATASTDFGEPTHFEPQKVVALRRAKWLAAAGAVVGIAAVAALVIALL